MLSKKIEKALNDQLARENTASHLYLSMASWCDKSGLHGSAGFLYGHAEQERLHMMKLLHYVNDAGGYGVVQAVEAPPADYKSLEEIFKTVYKHEVAITKEINRLVDLCLSESDHSSFNFLQWYVAEQHEEERLFMHILDVIKITGVEGRGLFFIDKEIAGLKHKS